MQVQATTAYSPSMEANRELANKIIAKRKDDSNVEKICANNDFYKNPTVHLVNEMIKRYVGRCRSDDRARAFVVSQIPDFFKTVSSPDYLKMIAVNYFVNEPKKDQIMTVFVNSLSSEEFKQDMLAAQGAFERAKIDKQEYYNAEDRLRIALTVFHQSVHLEPYTHPAAASLE